VEKAASAGRLEQLAREYQTTHKDQNGDQAKRLRVAKDNKINRSRALEEAVVPSEAVTKRSLQPDHDQPLHPNSQNQPSQNHQDLVRHRQILLQLDPQEAHRKQQRAARRHGLHFHMLLSVGRLSQHIGKGSPRSGYGDLKRTAVKSVENRYLSSLRDKSRISLQPEQIFFMQ
jgi:hypothetical protein